jgi:hypothetical protein
VGAETSMAVTRSRPSRRFGKVTVAFIDGNPSDDGWRNRRPDPELLPRIPVLELQG